MGFRPKTALALSGSFERLPFLQAVKNIGHRLLVIDSDPAAPGLALADQADIFPISDRTRLLAFARAHQLDYLVPLPLGRMLIQAGYLNDQLGLSGVSELTANLCTDKAALHNCLQHTTISQAQQFVFDTRSEFWAALDKLGYPCLLKPRFGSGSRGVHVLRSASDAYCWETQNWARMTDRLSESFLLESLMPGEEFGVDGLVEQGVLKWIFVRQKKLMPFPDRIVHQYLAPILLDKQALLDLTVLLTSLFQAIQFENGLFHADILYDVGNFHLIEFSPRPAGFLIYDQIIGPATNAPILETLISQVADLPYQLPAPACAVALSYFPFTGWVQSVPDPSVLKRSYPLLHRFAPRFCTGEFLPPIKTGADLINRGFVSVCAPDLAVAAQQLDALLGEIQQVII